jgi:hypothetical protein
MTTINPTKSNPNTSVYSFQPQITRGPNSTLPDGNKNRRNVKSFPSVQMLGSPRGSPADFASKEVRASTSVTSEGSVTSGTAPTAAYSNDGCINPEPFQGVLKAIHDALDNHKGKCQKLVIKCVNQAQHGISNLIHDLGGDKVKQIDSARGDKIYIALKGIASSLWHASKLSPSTEKVLPAMTNLMIQLARTEFYESGISAYDEVANKKHAELMSRNPAFDKVFNSTVSKVKKLDVNGGADIGVISGVVNADVGVGGGISYEKTKLFTHDLDGDILTINTKKSTQESHVNVTAGILPISLKGQGKLSGSLTSGTLNETTNTAEAFRAEVNRQRDGDSGKAAQRTEHQSYRGRGWHGALHAIAHNTKAKVARGSDMVRAVKNGIDPSATDLSAQLQKFKRANVSVASPGVRNALDQVKHVVNRPFQGAVPKDNASYLTKEKLIKGLPSMVLEAIPHDVDLPNLKKTLEDAYGNIAPRVKPDGMGNTVLSGQWNELSGEVGGGIDFSVKIPLVVIDDITFSGRLNLGLSHRLLPVTRHVPPHVPLDPNVCSDADEKFDNISKSKEFAGYLRYGDELKTRNPQDIPGILSKDIDLFESQANKLLAGVSMSLSKQGDKQAGLRVAKNAAGILAEKFLPGLDSTADDWPGKLALGHPEKFIAQCWNSLSIGAAVASRPDITGKLDDVGKATLEEQKTRLTNPDILMAADTFYQHSVLPVTSVLKRSRATGNVGVGISVSNLLLKTGSKFDVKFTYDKVSQHPNPLRNGEFLEIAIDLTGLPAISLPLNKYLPKIFKQLEGHPDFKHNLGGLNFELHAPTSLLGNLPVGLEAGISFTGGDRYTLALHKPDRALARDQSNPDGKKLREDQHWQPMYFQQSTTRSIQENLRGDGTFSFEYGAHASGGVSSSASETKPQTTVLFGESSVQLLQFDTFKENCKAAGIMDDKDNMEFGSGTPSQAKNAADPANLLTQTYFSTDGILKTVENFAQMRADGAGDPTKADYFNSLACEPFGSDIFKKYLNDSAAPSADELSKAVATAKKEIKGKTAAQCYKYFTEGRSTVGMTVMNEYVRGMTAISDIKTIGRYNKGTNVVSPLDSSVLNSEMALPSGNHRT